MKAVEASTRLCRWKLENFLLKYRTTPHRTIGRTPASLFLGQNPHTRLDLLKPNCGDHVPDRQAKQVQHHEQFFRTQDLSVGQTVMARNCGQGAKWVAGVIQQKQGPVAYVVETEKGLWKRHIDQLRERENSTNVSTPESTDDSEDLDLVLETGATRDTPPSGPEHPRPEAVPEVNVPPPPVESLTPGPVPNRQPPDYFGH